MESKYVYPKHLKASYRATFRSLLNRYIDAKGVQPQTPEHWHELAKWMVLHVRPVVSNATWSNYRSVISAACRDVPEVTKLMKVKGLGRRGDAKRGSGKRKKNVTGEDISKVCVHLYTGRYRWGRPAATWLEAGALTGLRPSEWVGARTEYIDNHLFLRVLSIKGNSGNPIYKVYESENKKVRYIPLNHLTSEEVGVIYTQIAIANTMHDRGSWEVYYVGCRRRINRSSAAVFPNDVKQISLYSARHFFARELKMSGYDNKLAGRLMGQNQGNAYKRVYGGRIPKHERRVLSSAYQLRLKAMLDKLHGDSEAWET